MEKKKQNLCPHADQCGGCQYQGIEYKKQLEKKKKRVEDALPKGIQVYPVIGMDDPLHYRNKIHAAFGRTKKGEIIYGVYRQGTHRIVPVEHCMIQDEAADSILRDIRELVKSFKIRIYDEDSGYGLLRHVMIRRGHATGEILVVLVMASPVFPSKKHFVQELIKRHPEITSIVQNVNERHTSMVIGKRNITLYGPGFIRDELCGNVFSISPSSFYQINSVQTKVLYQLAVSYAKLDGSQHVIDAYCGIGTIGMTAAKQAKTVTGVELNPDAVRDAAMNAKRNGCKNIRFVCADAGEYMKKLAAREAQQVDVVFMDPPRSGSTAEFIGAVKRLSPKRVVYISCNPDTLGRDLRLFKTYGYTADFCQPVDMFPYTDDVEAVTVLERREEKQHGKSKQSESAGSGDRRYPKGIQKKRTAAGRGQKKTAKQKDRDRDH